MEDLFRKTYSESYRTPAVVQYLGGLFLGLWGAGEGRDTAVEGRRGAEGPVDSEAGAPLGETTVRPSSGSGPGPVLPGLGPPRQGGGRAPEEVSRREGGVLGPGLQGSRGVRVVR